MTTNGDNSNRTVYVNGEYLPEDRACVSVFDRGYLFADGVYEVTAVVAGHMVDFLPHMQRLERSLAAIDLAFDVSVDEISNMHANLIEKNSLNEGVVYMQVTRGVADRDFRYPGNCTPSHIAFTKQANLLVNPLAENGVKVVTMPDMRWARRDIKSIALLPQAMAKQAAHEAGAFEGWMLEDGLITEGTSSTAYIVKDSRIITRPLSQSVLAGVTRKTLLALGKERGIAIEQRPFSLQEVMEADEAFLTSASTFVMPVVEIDGHKIADGKPGPISRQMRRKYVEVAKAGLLS
jgi:D-alanine transaminase